MKRNELTEITKAAAERIAITKLFPKMLKEAKQGKKCYNLNDQENTHFISLYLSSLGFSVCGSQVSWE